VERAGDILKEYLKKFKYSKIDEHVYFMRGWSDIAGKDLSRHSKVMDIKQSTLFIKVDHPGWMQLLQMKKRAILKKIFVTYPGLGIKEIKIRVGSLDENGN
jgi:predicted nucleic acid-binding Zn ribbon protein